MELKSSDQHEHRPGLTARAEAIARAAHEGQTDKAGADYIDHPRRVSERVALIAPAAIREEAIAAAWLHDTVEDTGVGLPELREAGFPESVVDAVGRLSKGPGVGLEEYFARLCESPVARIVKVADLIDNTAPERAALLDEVTGERLRERYVRSWRLMLGM